MSLKSIKEAAQAYFETLETDNIKEQSAAWRKLAHECDKTVDKAIGSRLESRIIFYPRKAK